MNNIITIIQMVLGVLLMALVLLQAKGTGMGSTFGGDMGFYRTKRGFEKLMFRGTILVVALFIITSLIELIK
ncbi:MAG: preprotein translocase subunit SecG [Candidatus Daviesbacteria bacterium]|nr:preprotein translocase subunit SecG [Candidatus Daviesbacteria bacterium]